METYTIGLATDCSLDDDFFSMLELVAQNKSLSTYRIHPYNLNETLYRLRSDQIRFLFYYDRASDSSAEFYNLYNNLITAEVSQFINLLLQDLAEDKVLMHEKFYLSDVNVPKTIILPEYNQHLSVDLDNIDLDFLGRPFVIKPSIHTGAGEGVNVNATSLYEIEQKRIEFPSDKFLIQEKIIPKEEKSRRFWLRIFYVCGSVIYTWWNDQTHRYLSFSANDYDLLDCAEIYLTMNKIHEICGLKFFSSELAVTKEDKIFVIDYVNEICDMRMQSKFYDGVPDDIIRKIAEEIVRYFEINLKNSTNEVGNNKNKIY